MGSQLSVTDISTAQHLFARLLDQRVEIAAFVYVDHDQRLLGMRHACSNACDVVELPVRQVVIDALAFGAEAVVMAHNHPSGDARPTRADIAGTRQLARALEPLGVRLQDHLVIARGGVTSFRALGLL